MIGNMNLSPPPNPSDSAVEAALGLLAIAANPAACKARLDELIAAHDAIKQAHAEMEVERKRLIDENARAADLREKENLLAGKQTDIDKVAVAQAVAASALEAREQKVVAAESAATKRAADLAAAEQKLADKAAAFRAAIA